MGFKITDDRENRAVTIPQTQYIDTFLKRYRMDTCTPISTPMEPDVVLSKDDHPQADTETKERAKYPYRKFLGRITWLTVVSRLDLAFATSQLGQFSANPGKVHWSALRRVLRYLKGTRGLAPTLGDVGNTNPDILAGNTDTNWSRDPDDRRSTSGVDAPVSWNSKKQLTVATPSAGAEYMAISHSAKQALWLRQFLCDVGILTDTPPATKLFPNNTGAIALPFPHEAYMRTILCTRTNGNGHIQPHARTDRRVARQWTHEAPCRQKKVDRLVLTPV